MRRALVAAIAAAWIGAPALVAPVAAADLPPPYSQDYRPQGDEERGMWMEADEQERQVRESRFLINDPKLSSYVRGIFCRTVGDERCRNVRIYIVRIPHLNATMYANGMMTIWSGLLLRARNEAELGAVLGHEFAHFELRHSLRGFRASRTASDLAIWTVMLGVSKQITAAFYAFSRDQETQADLTGLHYLGTSPYPSSAAAEIWERTMAEQDATEAWRGRKAKHSYSTGFFASHPSELSRARYLREASLKLSDAGDPAEEAYRAAMAAWLPDFLQDQIKLNDFGGTEYLLGLLAEKEWTPELLYARAELYRMRGQPQDLASAALYYRQAIDKGFARADAQRGLGLALLRNGRATEGRAALLRYLDDNPNAPDRAMISTLVAE